MRRIREKNTRLVLAMLQHRHSNRSLARAAGVNFVPGEKWFGLLLAAIGVDYSAKKARQ